MNKNVLVIGIIFLLTGAGVVSSTGYIAKESNPSEIYFKMDSPTVLLDENFSGTFPPEGWETGFFGQNNSGCCDSEPPCARGEYTDPYYDNFMKSKAIDASNYEKCIIKFYFGVKVPYGSDLFVYLKYRRNETSSWIDITPWTYPMDDVCDYFEIEITNDPEGCGEALQIQWLFLGYYYYYLHTTCIDDVKILGIPINNPPSKPTINGPTGVPPGTYEYIFKATDPDGDDVSYTIEWGDSTSEETEYYKSGEEVTMGHTWAEKGTYTIQAKAKDVHELESSWGTLEVTVPRSKILHNFLFLKFLDRHQLILRLFNSYFTIV